MLKILKSFRNNGFRITIARIWTEIFHPILPAFSLFETNLRGKNGIEVGGPSFLFSRNGFLPLYSIIANLDNVNFGHETIWEGRLTDGGTFQFDDNRSGKQFVREASSLSGIPDHAYDFLISSHMLEHCANPIKALHEWKRVLKPHGWLVLVLPHKEGTFDRNRKTTELKHMIEDFENCVGEDDLTHAEEFIKDFDYAMHDKEDPETFRKDILSNYDKRRIHHHVFTTPVAVQLVSYAGFQIRSVHARLPGHIVILAEKTDAIDNALFLSLNAGWLQTSPFRSDRL